MGQDVVTSEKRDGVAVITIDSPPVNSLSGPVRAGLEKAMAEAQEDADVEAIVLRGANDNFVAGAEISELQKLAEGEPFDPSRGRTFQAWLDSVEQGAKPVVVAIDGFALGGGLELAMAGNYRVATTRCRVGLPEVKLGLYPGAGGTQRLPRLTGLIKACEMILTGNEARGRQTLELGIVDEIVEPDALMDAAVAAAKKLASGQIERRYTSRLTDKLGTPEEAKAVGEQARVMIGSKGRGLIHLDLCLEAIITGAAEGYEAGLKCEADNFEKCITSPQAAGMIHLFFASRAAAKVPGVTDKGFEPRKIRRVGLVGGGTMGSGIATWLINSGVEVILREVDADAAQAGRGRIEANLSSRVRKGKLSQEKFEAAMGRLTAQTDFSGYDDVDMMIEAVIEDIELKQQVFGELEKIVRPDCILASNTSTIDLNVIGKPTRAQQRILGTHFFSPAHVMPLVEIVRTEHTSPDVLASVVSLVKGFKKTPVIVGNCVGFLVNRIFFPYGQTAGLLADRGVHPYRIDKAIYAFGMPMGPFRMSDLAGVDVARFARGILSDAYPRLACGVTLVNHLVDAGRLGQKAGKGYYLYPDGKTAEEDVGLDDFLARSRADAGDPDPIDVSDEQIVEMAMFGVINEACRTLDEAVVIRASDIDVASVMGMGFPAYRGGIMKYADTVGAKAICEKLTVWTERFGEFFTPCDYLKKRAAEGTRLSA